MNCFRYSSEKTHHLDINLFSQSKLEASAYSWLEAREDQNKSNCSGQSQRTQTIYIANQNSKQVRVADVKRGKTRANESRLVIGFTSDWMRKRGEFLSQSRGSNVKLKLMQTMNCFWYSSEKTRHLDINLFSITESGFSVWNMKTRSLKNRSRVNKKNRYCMWNSFTWSVCSFFLLFVVNLRGLLIREVSFLLSESTSPESS